MTVEELRNELSSLPGGLEIVLSSDEEGNSFEPLYSLEECFTDELDFWRSPPPTSDKVLILWP